MRVTANSSLIWACLLWACLLWACLIWACLIWALRIDAEDRYRFDDRVIVRECVEGLDQQLPFSGLHVHEADGTKGNPSAGVECVDQFVLGRAVLELILQHPEHLCGDLFELKFRAVSQAPFALNLLDVSASQEHRHELALLGECLLERPDDLRERRAAAACEANQMPIAGDVDPSPIVASCDRTRFVRLQKLRMDRSSKYAQDMFCNRRTDR